MAPSPPISPAAAFNSQPENLAGSSRNITAPCYICEGEKLKLPSHLAWLERGSGCGMCDGGGGDGAGRGGHRKSYWLGLHRATSPECVTAAGAQHPLGRATEEQLW